VRDPRVGRDVLIGVAAACLANAISLILPAKELTVMWAGAMTSIPLALAEVSSAFSRVIADVIMPLIAFILLRWLLRRDLLAAAAYVVLTGVIGARNPAAFAVWAVVGIIMVGVLLRFGVLAFAAFNAANAVLVILPVVWPFESWYAGATFLGIAIIVGLATWGFVTSLAGRPIFHADLIEA
ncbi:MAG TPA: hypothetical protein VJ276_22050, partial [Thermoanaerobaculia bacterium]|nr:hypothetical protein [Thermoanaerobaculia bacterium]